MANILAVAGPKSKYQETGASRWYEFGFVIGIAGSFGGSSSQVSRTGGILIVG